MFPETASKIRVLLGDISNRIVLNLGSGTKHFYTVQQPYIWTEVMEPLVQRHNRLVNVDQKKEPGVDMQCDATELPVNYADVILCCNIIEHTTHPHCIIAACHRALHVGGRLLLECPANYPYHADPIDTGLRLKTAEDWDTFMGPLWSRTSFELIWRAQYHGCTFPPGQTSTLVVYVPA